MKKILFGTYLLIIACHCNNLHDMAVQNFVNYAKQLHIDYEAYQCNNWDNDSDGYISCSYTDKDKEVHQLECAAAFWFNVDGCRVPKMSMKVYNSDI